MPLRVVAISSVVVIMAAILCIEGVELLRFERLETMARRLSETTILAYEDRLARQGEINDAVQQLQTWTTNEAVADRARRMSGVLTAVSGDSAQIEKAVVELLTVAPTSGRQWLALAKLRWGRGAPFAKVLDALQMSIITEPWEFGTMNLRLPFMMRLWELLPDGERRQVINQLVELKGRMEQETRQELKAVIGLKPEATRAAIKANLAVRGVEQDDWVRALGL